MVYKVYTACRNSSAIAIVLLLINIPQASSTEYVFTAPPEVGEEVVEIPASETEYPLYECTTESEDRLDSHDCICTDCEEIESDSQLQESRSDSEIGSENESEQR